MNELEKLVDEADVDTFNANSPKEHRMALAKMASRAYALGRKSALEEAMSAVGEELGEDTDVVNETGAKVPTDVEDAMLKDMLYTMKGWNACRLATLKALQELTP